LSDRWQPDFYRISVKRIVEPRPGLVSNHVHDRLHVGDTVQARAPAGHFVLDDGDAPVVLVAGGIGITPVLSMLEASLAARPSRPVWLFYGLRHGGEHAMKARLAALAAEHANFHLCVCYSRPRPEDVPGRDYDVAGHVDVGLLRTSLPLLPFHFHVCGPRAMLETLVPALRDWGVPERHIHYEAFGPASLPARAPEPAPARAAATPIRVGFARQQQTHAWEPAAGSLLVFAEQHGIAVDFGCRAGGCGTCQTRIVSGEVSYANAPDFEPSPGTCLLCVATPKTDLVLDA
jgi:ferredoxin-NADP reductase